MLDHLDIGDQISVVVGPRAESAVIEEVGRAMASPFIINSKVFIINSLSFIERGLNDLRMRHHQHYHENRKSYLPEQSSILRHRKVFALY